LICSLGVYQRVMYPVDMFSDVYQRVMYSVDMFSGCVSTCHVLS
jgi:archaellum biogenesis protein FlaJ (TadC family)